ncbi:MAG: hypothetical protein ACLPX7_06485 [Xanthobacteraceae bacterium]
MTEALVRNIEHFVDSEGSDLIVFEKGQRKDDVTQRCLRAYFLSTGRCEAAPVSRELIRP